MYTASDKFEFADSVALLLSVQLVMPPARAGAVSRIEIEKGSINRIAIGYIYGFIDAALKCRNQDIADYDVGLPTLRRILQKLFPRHSQAYLDFLLNRLGDEHVVQGMHSGMRDYKEYFRSSATPFGLTQILLDS